METTDKLTAIREQKKFLEERERRAGIREANNGCAMVELQLLIGARSGEFLDLTPNDLDRSPKSFKKKNGETVTVNVWTVDISKKHKGAWRGKPRILYFGPRAQAILRPYLLNRPGDAPIFNPREVIAERHVDCKIHRRPDQQPSPRQTDRIVRDRYYNDSYRRAIKRACDAAEVPAWNPHRIRHSAATYLREEFGLEVASLILGHSNVEVTKIYAERNQAKALEVMSQWG